MASTGKAGCPSHEELVAFSAGKVTETALGTISEHLEACENCISVLLDVQNSDDSLVDGLRTPPSGEQFLDEPEYQQAVEKVQAIGIEALVPERPDAQTPRPLPRKFGRYMILEALGQGGMGVVYLARDTQLGREIALKIPHFRRSQNPHLLERFYREARAAATIDDPNLCPVYDVGEIDGVPYLTMARIRGKSLSNLLKAGKEFSDSEAAQIVQRVALAVEKAHACGIVHRDIKPSNIMITEEGEPILTDFGLAQRLELEDPRLTGSGVIVGTPSYMAPEQVDGDPETLGPACDIYSLGVVLYELLTGRAPFEGPLLSVLSRLGRDQPDSPSEHRPDVDRRLEAICLKAMAKAPANRYQSAGQLADALEQYLQAPVPPSRRRRLAWITAAAAALLFVFGAVITVVTNRGTLEIKTLDDDVKVSVLKNGQEVIIVDTKTQKEITLHAGRYELRLSEGQEGLWLTTKEFTLRRGEKIIVEVRSQIERGPPSVARSDHDLPSPREPLAAGASAPGDLLQVFEPPAGEGDGFGHWIAAEDNKVLIGAVYGNAAYLYDARTGALLHTFRGKGGHFGLAVAMAGDTVLVTASSATNDSTNATDAGAIYLFHFNESGNEWEEPIIVYGKAPHDQLGCCVASLGDNFLVGAMQEAGSGEAYLLDASSGTRLLTFRNPRGAAGREDYFGRGLAALGNDVLVGAPHDDTDAPDAGIVYLFDGTTGRLRLTLHNPKGAAGEGNWFGYVQTIAAVGGNILVGTYNLGTAYLFDGSSGKLLRTFERAGGSVVTAVGNNALIGTSLFDSRTGDLLQTFRAPPGAGGRFGHTIGALDNNVLIGAFHAKKVYLFAGPESHTAVPGRQGARNSKGGVR